jgi:hypothetical protein
MGIGRFEATLLIAAVQHREADAPVSPTRNASPPPDPAWKRPMRFVLTALSIQGLIAAAAWWVVVHA